MTVYYVHNKKIYTDRVPILGKSNVRLWFHDDIFSKADWKTEPLDDIDTIYKKRAQFLRDKYNHLILMYSGGADSTQVLRSFIDNNIHLDEVHTFFPLKMLKAIEETEYPNNYNLSLLKEYNEAVIPRLRMLAITHPEIKIKVWDITTYINNNHLSDNFLEDNKNIFGVNNKFMGIKAAAQILLVRDYIDHIPNVGVIYGGDRPNFFYESDEYFFHENSKLYFFFSDLGRTSPGSFENSNILNYTPILFYWDPDAPEIVIKQSHMYKKLIESGKVNLPVHRDSKIMKKLLYPSTFEPDIWQQTRKYNDSEILMYFYGNKEVQSCKELGNLKVGTKSKLYRVG